MSKNKPPFLFKLLKSWLPLAAGLTVVLITAFTMTQQSLRLGANAAPAQLAYDAQITVFTGQDPAENFGNKKTEISSTLFPFLMVFDENGQLTFSSATLFGNPPELPAGVLEYTREHHEDRITWQPAPGVREALVIVHMADGGFVAGGQSLRETENTIKTIQTLGLVGWVGAMGLTLALAVLLNWLGYKSGKQI